MLFGNPIRANLLTAAANINYYDKYANTPNNDADNDSGSGSSNTANTENTERKFCILVVGGSRGEVFFNQLIPHALGDLDNVKIIHQTGQLDYETTKQLYIEQGTLEQHQVQPFIDDMAQAYRNADLIICRAGSSTIFEIMAMGAASILVPLPTAIDDHQTMNAKYLADNRAALLVNQRNLTASRLVDIVRDLIAYPDRLQAMRAAAKQLHNQYQCQNNIGYLFGD